MSEKILVQHIPKNPSKIALVGEALGKDEEAEAIKATEQGKKRSEPFIGYEGRKLLTPMLSKAGIHRDDIYITNTVHVKPKKNDYSTLPKSVIEAGREQLRRDLEEWKGKGLNLVIACGAKALKTLTGHNKLFAVRGTVLPCTLVPGLKVLPTLHPGALLKGNGRFQPVISIDIKKAVDESLTRTIHYPYHNIQFVSDKQEAIEILERFTDYSHPIACDIETAGSWMIAFGIADSHENAYVLTKEVTSDRDVLRCLSKMAYSSTPKIYHNCLFDCFHNAYYYKIINNNIIDTMIAQHCTYPTLPKSLAFCASIYTNEPYWKASGQEFFEDLKKGEGDWEQLYNYNGKDCCLTYKIWEDLREELSDWGVWEVYNKTMETVRPVLFAMMKGIKVDGDAVQRFADKNERAIEALEKMIQKSIGEINPNSSQQKMALLYDEWKMPIQYKKGRKTVENKKLRRLESFPTPYRYKIGLLRCYMEYRKKRDFYVLSVDPDNRIRTALNPTGTYTGRWSSSKCITGSGQNLQNLPKETRLFYKADDGKIFIQMDLSQSEARIVAALCRDSEWLAQFDREDVHAAVAAFLYDIEKGDVEKSTHRQISKRVSHAAHYLLGKILLSEILGISPKEAQSKKEKYFEMRPNLATWHRFIKTTIRQERLIETCFGRKIQFFGPIFDQLVTDATAAEPQSTSADYLRDSIIRCYEEIDEFEFLLQVHDSILCQVPDDVGVVKKVAKSIKKLTEKEVVVRGIPLTIPADFEIGYSWGDLVEVKDLDKIEEVYNGLVR